MGIQFNKVRSLPCPWGQFHQRFFKYFFGVPHSATCIFLFYYNEPELGVGIDLGMALSSISI